MQRFQTPVLCAGSALLASLVSFGPAPTEVRPQGSDAALAALREQVTALEAKVETCQQFMLRQAAAGKGLTEALARSEAEGFTAGINPRSREVLLDGLRAQAKAMQPAATSTDDKAKDSDRRQGRRRDR